MKEDIKHKLIKAFQTQKIEESDVVYILVQIGKLINLTQLKDEYPSLYFYRNWVVHEEISHQSQFIRELKEIFKNVHEHTRDDRGIISFTSGRKFKNELFRFAQNQLGFSPRIDFINTFMDSLMKVIADVPITLQLSPRKKMILAFDSQGVLQIIGPDHLSRTIRVLIGLI